MCVFKKLFLLVLYIPLLPLPSATAQPITINEPILIVVGNVPPPPKQPQKAKSPTSNVPTIIPYNSRFATHKSVAPNLSIPGITPGVLPNNGNTASGTAASGPRGGAAFSRPSWNAPALMMFWEEWWLRNQFQYLELPSESSGFFLAGTAPVFTRRKPPLDADKLRSRSIDAFQPFLEDRSARLREAALLSLGVLNDEGSLPDIIAALNDENLAVRLSAAVGLGLIESTQAKHTLLNLIKNNDIGAGLMENNAMADNIRSIAGIMLAMSNPDTARPVLSKNANNASLSIQNQAMALLGLGMTGKESVQPLGEISRDKKREFPLTSTTICSLGVTFEPSAVPWILEALNSNYAAVQQSAALALGGCSPKVHNDSINHLFHCYKNTRDRMLRGFTLVSIGRIGGASAMQRLKSAAMNGSSLEMPWVCLGIGIATRDSGSRWAEEFLLYELEKNSNLSIKKAAAVALGLSGCQGAEDELIRMLKEGDDPYLRGYCALALGMIKSQKALPVLREHLLKENTPQISTQAAVALSLMNDKTSIPKLIKLFLTTKNETTKRMTSICLVYLGDLYVANQLLEHLVQNETDEMTSAYCMELISKVITGYKVSRLKRIAAQSNYACEFPLMWYLFDFDV